MALNPANVDEYKKKTMKDLVADAVERKDLEALKWLEKESKKKIDRTKTDGTITKVDKPIPAIRAEYAKKYLGYTNKSKASAEAQRKKKAEKKEQARATMFGEAYAMLKQMTEANNE